MSDTRKLSEKISEYNIDHWRMNDIIIGVIQMENNIDRLKQYARNEKTASKSEQQKLKPVKFNGRA